MKDREINTDIQSKRHRDRRTNIKIMKHRLERQRQGCGDPTIPLSTVSYRTSSPSTVNPAKSGKPVIKSVFPH